MLQWGDVSIVVADVGTRPRMKIVVAGTLRACLSLCLFFFVNLTTEIDSLCPLYAVPNLWMGPSLAGSIFGCVHLCLGTPFARSTRIQP